MEDYYISSRFERFAKNVNALFGEVEESVTDEQWEVIREDIWAAKKSIDEMEVLGADTPRTELHGDTLSRLEECAAILHDTDFGTEESNEESYNAFRHVEQIIKNIRGWKNDLQRVIEVKGYDGRKAGAND